MLATHQHLICLSSFSRFDKTSVHFSASVRAHSAPKLIILLTLHEEYSLWSSSLRNFQ